MDMTVGRARGVDVESHTRELGPDLGWLTSVLWPEGDVRVSPTRVPPGRRVAEAYAVIPNAECPRMLVPFAAPRLAERALRRYDDGMSFAAVRLFPMNRMRRGPKPYDDDAPPGDVARLHDAPAKLRRAEPQGCC